MEKRVSRHRTNFTSYIYPQKMSSQPQNQPDSFKAGWEVSKQSEVVNRALMYITLAFGSP